MVFDLKPTLTYAEAVTESESTGLLGVDYTSCSMYHFPFTCKDKWTQARIAYGLSGAAYAAKHAVLHSTLTLVAGTIPLRAKLAHSSTVPRSDRSTVSVLLISMRCTPHASIKVATSSTGQMIIDDALTTYGEENYLRFQHVPSTFDAISRFFFQLGRKLEAPTGRCNRGQSDA